MSALEIAANGFNLASIVLAGRNHIYTWWTGIVGSVLFGLLFGQARLYADAALQAFFIVTSVLGWMAWSARRGADPALPMRRATRRMLALGAGLAVVVTLGWAGLLAATTNAAAPLPDSAVLAFSILGQLLLMGRLFENWWCWLLVNTIAVPLYASRGLWLTSALYVVFWGNALVALRFWRTNLPEQRARPDRRAS